MIYERNTFTVIEVHEILGLSVESIYRRIRSGDIPSLNFAGRRKLIPRSWVEEQAGPIRLAQ